MHSTPSVHAYRLLIPHPDVSDAQLLGGNSDFGHGDADDAKHVLHILGAKNREINARAPPHLTGDTQANLLPSHSHRSPRLQDNSLAPEGFRRSLTAPGKSIVLAFSVPGR